MTYGSSSEKPKRVSSGRRKIPIQKIAKVDALHVCFSKRRRGLFKKAAELSTLCGVQIAVVAFSPGGKAFTFGHPSVDSVIDRFLDPVIRNGAVHPGLEHRIERSREDFEELMKRIGEEEAKEAWWTMPIDGLGLGLEELVAMKERAEDLRSSAIERFGEIKRARSDGNTME